EAANAQIEKSFAQWFGGRLRREGERGNIGGAVFFGANVDVRLAHADFRKGDFAAPEGIDLKSGVNFFCGKQRFSSGRFLAMDDETLDGGAHGKPLDGKAADFSLAAGNGIDPFDGQAAKQRIAGAAAKEDGYRDQNERNFDAQHPGYMAQPSPFAADGRLRRHGWLSSSILVTRRRAWLSLSHLSACSFVPRWARAS